MEDLSGILVPKIPVKDGMPALPQTVMDSFSDQAVIDQATKLMGFGETATEGAADGGS